MIGPPRAPPYVLRINLARGRPDLLLKKSFAVVLVFRLAKNSAPCHSLLPLLLTNEICAPEERPADALALTVVTRNSSIASAFNRITGWFCPGINWPVPP